MNIKQENLEEIYKLKKEEEKLLSSYRRLISARKLVSEQVYKRVLAEYKGNIHKLREKILQSITRLKQEHKQDFELLYELERREHEARDSYEEALLKHHIGDLDDKRFQKIKQQYKEKMTGIEAQLGELKQLKEQIQSAIEFQDLESVSAFDNQEEEEPWIDMDAEPEPSQVSDGAKPDKKKDTTLLGETEKRRFQDISEQIKYISEALERTLGDEPPQVPPKRQEPPKKPPIADIKLRKLNIKKLEQAAKKDNDKITRNDTPVRLQKSVKKPSDTHSKLITAKTDSGRIVVLPILFVVGGPHRGQYYSLGRENTSIGNGIKNLINLELDSEVTEEHCLIKRVNNLYFIKDLGSISGVRVNDKKATWQQLENNDTIDIGSSTLIFINDPQDERIITL